MKWTKEFAKLLFLRYFVISLPFFVNASWLSFSWRERTDSKIKNYQQTQPSVIDCQSFEKSLRRFSVQKNYGFLRKPAKAFIIINEIKVEIEKKFSNQRQFSINFAYFFADFCDETFHAA